MAAPPSLNLDARAFYKHLQSVCDEYTPLLDELLKLCKASVLNPEPWDHQKLYVVFFACHVIPVLRAKIIEDNRGTRWAPFFEHSLDAIMAKHLDFKYSPRELVRACLNTFFVL